MFSFNLSPGRCQMPTGDTAIVYLTNVAMSSERISYGLQKLQLQFYIIYI